MIEINQLSKKLLTYKQYGKLPKVLYVVGMIDYEEVAKMMKEIYEINPIDFFEISVEDNKKLIGLNQVKKFNKFLSSRAYYTNKLAVVNRADLLTIEAANDLLKSLEELQSNCYILLFSNQDNLIPTLKSRVILTVNVSDSLKNKPDKELAFYKNNLLDNIFWIENESQKINLEDFLNNALKVAPNYAIKDKILYLLRMAESNINKKLILEYLAIVSSNSQE